MDCEAVCACIKDIFLRYFIHLQPIERKIYYDSSCGYLSIEIFRFYFTAIEAQPAAAPAGVRS